MRTPIDGTTPVKGNTIAIVFKIEDKEQVVLIGDVGLGRMANANAYERYLVVEKKIHVSKITILRVWACGERWPELQNTDGQRFIWCSPNQFQRMLDIDESVNGKKRKPFTRWVFTPLDRRPDTKVTETARFAPQKT